MNLLPHSLNLPDTLGCGQAFRWKTVEGGVHAAYVGVVDGSVIQIRRKGDGSNDQRKIGEGGKEKVERNSDQGVYHYISSGYFDPHSYFRLEDDLDTIHQSISVDMKMKEVVRQFSGMRLLRQDPFETLISFIISQTSNIPRITSTIERLSRSYGRRIRFLNKNYYAFPEPEQLARVQESDLRKLGLGYRAPYVREAAIAVHEGSMDLEGLRGKTYGVARKELMELKGVGPKVADCVLLFSLDKLEAFPVDRWMKRVIGELYFHGIAPSEKRIQEWAGTNFGTYAGYAQQYLFHFRRKKHGRVQCSHG